MSIVYFATNRKPRPKSKPTNFGKEFSDEGLSNLRFGKADVVGRRVTVRVHTEKLVPASGANRTDTSASKFGSTTLFDSLRKNMLQHESDTIVFIHGYNTSFKDAMRTAARIGSNFSSLNDNRGVNVLVFSWPSDGSMMPWLAYTSDRRDASASGPAFARGMLKLRDFLQALTTEEVCRQRLHLIAHSMGNYVLRHALQEIRRQSAAALPRVFDQIFLMAADEDDNAFEYDHKLRMLPRLARHVNVYFNRGDTAMSISDRTKANPDRLGDDGPRGPFQVPAKVTQIDCSNVVDGLVEHSYFVDNATVVADMMHVLNGVDPMAVPGRRFLDDRNRFVIAGE